MPCKGEFSPINLSQFAIYTRNVAGAWKCFRYKPLKTYSKLNSGKEVCHGISIHPWCRRLFTMPDVHCTLIYVCLPVASPKQNGLCNHLRYGGTITWRKGLRSFHAGLARPSMLCLVDKLPTWPWMPWTTALLPSYYNQVSSYVGLKFADAAHEPISIRLKVTPSKSINWPSLTMRCTELQGLMAIGKINQPTLKLVPTEIHFKWK